ncbi:unnamed protein product [Mytilus edulis]|uniref:CCHC-type domain-containing protein n=1 Tax=Mytilus edulis TaxID=6550 RepID=A0A8S3S9R4_MYTED|nr:unnamed protein product [Mytilus edulis]
MQKYKNKFEQELHYVGGDKTAVKTEENRSSASTVKSTPKTTLDERPISRYRNEGPIAPKLATFDGKSEWKPYYLQFIHIANKYNWDTQQKLDKLIECLREKALKFFSTRPLSIQTDFKLLADKLNQRFGNKDLPYTIRRQLQDVRQNGDEMIEEFAERIQEMATDGYIDTPEHVVETISVDAFLKGCTDKKAALLAMEKSPTRMDQALQFVKSSIHNQRVLLGYKKSDVRRVQFEKYDQDDSDDDSEIAVRVVNKKPNYVPWQETIEKRVLKTEQDITGINNNVKILKILETRGNDNRRPRSPSPSRSPARTVTCYTCNQEGHYSNQCENKSNNSSPMRRNRSPSPVNSRPNVHLNEQGSKKFKISEVSVNDPYGPTVAASLILKVKINGVDVDAVVDTAAQVTIISEKFMKKLQPPLELKSSVTLKGAGAENKIKARYANRVSIRTGKTETKWQIIVADITDSVLLGLDFLQHLQAVIDLANYTVKINNQTLQASAVKSNNKEMKVCRVTLNQNVVIPSMTAIEFSAMLEGKVNSDICFQPNQNFIGIMMPYIVTTPDKTVPITIRNLTDKNISLRKGTNLGTAVEIDEVLENQNPEQNSITARQISRDGNHSKKTEEVCQNMPENLKDLFERSKENLNEKESIHRAQRTWEKLENDVDDVVPLAVRSIQHQLQDDISIQESNWMKGWSLEDIKKEQEDDPDLKTLINWLHTGESPSEHDLQLESPATNHWWNCTTQLKFVKGCLFYKWLDPAEPRTLLLLPKSLKEEAMQYCHDCKTAGHFGQAKTIQKLQQRFIWYQMRVDAILIDSATKIGESKKLRAPWQGPYLIVEVLSSVLYKMRTRKRELTIHHDQLKPCLDRNIPPWLKYMRHRLLQGEVDYSLGIGQTEEENIHDLSQLFKEDNDREPDLFVQETEDGINKDHAGSTGLESFQQLQDLESFLDITEEIQEIGVEQHSTGLETRYSSDVDLGDRHIVTNLDGINVFLNNDSIDNLDDTFLYAIDNYGGRIRNRPKYLDDYDLSDMF